MLLYYLLLTKLKPQSEMFSLLTTALPLEVVPVLGVCVGVVLAKLTAGVIRVSVRVMVVMTRQAVVRTCCMSVSPYGCGHMAPVT
jgi:hypothetical protein